MSDRLDKRKVYERARLGEAEAGVKAACGVILIQDFELDPGQIKAAGTVDQCSHQAGAVATPTMRRHDRHAADPAAHAADAEEADAEQIARC